MRHWKCARRPGSGVALAVNAVGAGATTVALSVIVIAKFAEGAWITLILIPGLLILFGCVRQHYAHVAERIRFHHAIELSQCEPPIVVVPIAGWNIVSERALWFGLQLSRDVTAVYVSRSDGDDADVRRDWEAYVATPLRQAGRPEPRLQIIASPYRRVIRPLVEYVNQLKDEHPRRLIAVVVPELVETRWYQHLLHNHYAEWLKADLLLEEDERVVVINVPWYLSAKPGTDPA